MKKENNKSKLTPWEVSGNIDYNRLIKDFGIEPLKSLPKEFEENILFRRKVVFAHRDIQKILEAVKTKKKFVMLTGFVPSGKFHIGHLIVSLQMAFWQKLGAKVYITVADIEGYNARGISLEEGRKIALEEYIPNFIAAGLDLKKAKIYFQSENPAAYHRLAEIASNHVTFNEIKAIYGDISPGKLISALMQSSDILHSQLPEFEGTCPVIVPVGVDQDPHLRLTRDISQRLKYNQFISPSSTYHYFVAGLKGGKMSSSDATSYISPSDSPQEVKNKINKYAFSGGKDTLEEHRKYGGNPDIDVSFQYLKTIFEPNDKKLLEIEKNYKSGKLTTGELKAYTIEKINSFLEEHQIKLEKARKEVKKVFG